MHAASQLTTLHPAHLIKGVGVQRLGAAQHSCHGLRAGSKGRPGGQSGVCVGGWVWDGLRAGAGQAGRCVSGCGDGKQGPGV